MRCQHPTLYCIKHSGGEAHIWRLLAADPGRGQISPLRTGWCEYLHRVCRTQPQTTVRKRLLWLHSSQRYRHGRHHQILLSGYHRYRLLGQPLRLWKPGRHFPRSSPQLQVLPTHTPGTTHHSPLTTHHLPTLDFVSLLFHCRFSDTERHFQLSKDDIASSNPTPPPARSSPANRMLRLPNISIAGCLFW